MKRSLPVVALAVVSLVQVQANAEEVSRAAVVKFNTVCARCHEGECSGRLSFSSGVEATHGHVRRHLPSSTPLEVAELFAILKFTKEDCAHYPLPDAVPTNGAWDAEVLRQWRGSEGEGYFIPLGRMRAGTYRIRLRFDSKSEASVRITSEKFEVLLEEQQCKDLTFDRALTVTEEASYYLHLKSSATLLSLTLARPR